MLLLSRGTDVKSASPSGIIIPPRFVVSFTNGATGNRGYLTADGQETNDPSKAAAFSINPDGVLLVADGRSYSTSPGVEYQPFAPSTTNRADSVIDKVWSYEGGKLTWHNDQFYNRTAQFCTTSSNQVIVYFVARPPAICGAPLDLGIDQCKCYQNRDSLSLTPESNNTTGSDLY